MKNQNVTYLLYNYIMKKKHSSNNSKSYKNIVRKQLKKIVRKY